MFNTMPYDDIFAKLSSIKNGTMARIKYFSEMPIRATYKKQGIHLYKITEVTVRFGVNYNNIASVVEKKSENNEINSHKTTYSWVNGFENKICYNENTGKNYVRFTYLPHGDNRHINYKIVKIEETYTTKNLSNEDKELIIPSYWNKQHNMPEVQNIAFDHIISIG